MSSGYRQSRLPKPIPLTPGCVGGTLGHDDGFVEPHMVLMGYKNKVISMGVQYIHPEVREILDSKANDYPIFFVYAQRLVCWCVGVLATCAHKLRGA